MKMSVLVLLAFLLMASPVFPAEFEHFRVMYDRFWDYAELGELGFDCVYGPWDSVRDLDFALSRWANRSLQASHHGMQYICGPYYQAGAPQINYTRAVDRNGRRDRKTPSPIDHAYWDYVVERVGLAIANLSTDHPISGIVWDIEHYGNDHFEDWDYTYDQSAISLFAEDMNITVPDLPGGERHDWFQTHGLLEEFFSWQEETVYQMALETRVAIHEINPDLSLGVLGFEDDCWLHLSILRGFSTTDKRVTAWHEDSFWGGYKRSKIDDNHEDFARLGINGKVIPGLWTYELDPYQLLFNMAYALRYNGTFWIYQHGSQPWALGSKEDYRQAFQLLQDHICPGAPDFLPSFYIYPGVELMPWVNEFGASAIINSDVGATEMGLAFSTLQISPTISKFNYTGEDMEIEIRTNTTLPLEEDGFIYALDIIDIEATRAWSILHELEDLVTRMVLLDLASNKSLRQGWKSARFLFGQGNYELAAREANRSLTEVYDLALNKTCPLVEEGLANPRNTTIPFIIINKINIAKRCLESGEQAKGRMYMLKALNDWVEIPEATSYLPTAAILCLLLLRGYMGTGANGPRAATSRGESARSVFMVSRRS